jgi:putative addiction module component (TIGR02574 family)
MSHAVGMAVRLKDILKLSLAQRMRLVEQIWYSIAADPDELPVTPAQAAELDRRLQAHRRHPDRAVPWPIVHARLKRRLAVHQPRRPK